MANHIIYNKIMPVNDKGQFTFPGVNGSRVGERLFYINEDPWDGAPTLRYILKTRSVFNGIGKQEVFPNSERGTLAGYDLTSFYSTAEEARDEYVAYARHRLEQAFDPNRPGDVMQRESIQRNLDRLLVQDWKKVVGEARESLESVLADRKWGKAPIPVQEHLIGETITGDDGNKAEVAEVELVNEKGEFGIVVAESLRVVYRDRRGRQIKIAP